MSFLQSLFLIGLTAAVIPVLIHLLNRPRARVIRFSTLEFVKRLQIRRSKRLRVREFLLLLLRVVLLALLAIAFARPALQGSLARGLGGTVRTSACIVLDASYSMAYESDDGTLFARAKERGREVVDLLKEGDESFLVLASRSPESRFDQPTHNFRLLRAEIEKAPRSSRGTDLPLALREAARALEDSRNPNREIYLVTDMQRSGFRIDSADWDALIGDDVRLFILPVGEGDRSNVAVTGAELFEPRRFGDMVRIRGTVTNYSAEPVEVLATLLLDGERRGTASLTIEPGRSDATIFSLSLGEGGTHRGEIRIGYDRLEEDNAFYFTLERPDNLRVLVIGDSSSQDYFYLTRALAPKGGGGMVEVESARPGEIRSVRLGDFHAVFLLGVPSLADRELAELESYQREGGGIIIVPGDGIDFGSYNQALLPRLFGPVKLGESLVEHRSRPVGVEWFDADHPAFALFPKGVDRALQELRISRHIDLDDSDLGESVRQVARTGDGRPFLLEARKGAGRTILISTGFDLSWSDLPTQPVFLPLVHEMVRYLYAGGALYKRSLAVGRPYTTDLTGVNLGTDFVCTTPSGEQVTLQPRSDGERLVLEFDDTHLPGFYHVTGGDYSDWFAVNLETEESDLMSIPPADVLDEIPVSNAVVIGAKNRLDRPVLGARFGRELWWELIALALVIAVVELLVAQGSRQTVPARG